MSNIRMKNEAEFEFDEVLNMGFTTVPNRIFESDLTFNAVGVYCTIIKMRNANGWKVYQSTLVSDKNGRTKVMNAMKELIEKGWIEKIQLRNEKGHLNGVKYIIRSIPTVFQPKSEKPTSVKPTSDKPKSDNVPLQIKTNTNKENTNKNNTNKYTTQCQSKKTCSSSDVDVKDSSSSVNLIENNTHLILTNNQIKKVNSWNIDRLRKSIEIFREQQGKYFALLEKIYNDNGNFVSNNNKTTNATYNNNKSSNFANFTQREYDYDKLEKQLLGWDIDEDETPSTPVTDKHSFEQNNESVVVDPVDNKPSFETVDNKFERYLIANEMKGLEGVYRTLEFDKFVKNGLATVDPYAN